MARHLVVSGGPLHDFAATTAALAAVADGVGLTTTVPADAGEALDRLADEPGWAVVTVNALLWSMAGERYDHLRDRWAHPVSAEHLDALHRHVQAGGGLLALHTAPICFDGDGRWTGLLGASWRWDRSWHPPPGPVEVRATAAGARHPLTASCDGFRVDDEVYCDLAVAPHVDPLLVAAVDDVDRPLFWCQHVGRGRVVVDLLGHQARSLEAAPHAALLGRALRWLAADTNPDAPAAPTPTELHR